MAPSRFFWNSSYAAGASSSAIRWVAKCSTCPRMSPSSMNIARTSYK